MSGTAKVSRADRCLCPENQPAFDYLKGIHQRPHISSGYQATLKNAMKSIKKYPLPIGSEREAKQLHGVGEHIAESIMHAMRRAQNASVPPAPPGDDSSRPPEESGRRRHGIKRGSFPWYLLSALQCLQSPVSPSQLTERMAEIRSEQSLPLVKAPHFEAALEKLVHLELVNVEGEGTSRLIRLKGASSGSSAKGVVNPSDDHAEPSALGKRSVNELSLDLTQQPVDSNQGIKRPAIERSISVISTDCTNTFSSMVFARESGHFSSRRIEPSFGQDRNHWTLLHTLNRIGKPAKQAFIMVEANKLLEDLELGTLNFSEMKTALNELMQLRLVRSSEEGFELSPQALSEASILNFQEIGKSKSLLLNNLGNDGVGPSSSVAKDTEVILIDDDEIVSSPDKVDRLDGVNGFPFEIPSSPKIDDDDVYAVFVNHDKGRPELLSDFVDLTQDADDDSSRGGFNRITRNENPEVEIISIEENVHDILLPATAKSGLPNDAASILRRLHNVAESISTKYCSVSSSDLNRVDEESLSDSLGGALLNSDSSARSDSPIGAVSRSCLGVQSCSSSNKPMGHNEKCSHRITTKYSQLRCLPSPLSQYDVVLLVDERERKEMGTICSGLAADNILFEVCTLSVGDYLFVCRLKDAFGLNEAYVLDCIIERKIAHDLAQSIVDGRWKEQKFRMKQSGLRNVLYLMEGDLVTLYSGSKITATHLKTAAIQAPVYPT